MIMLKLKYFIVLCMLLLTSCTTQSAQYSRSSSSTLGDANVIKNRLEEQYFSWKGTPYRYGGMSKTGIDCSAFVLLTAKDKFNVLLPRTTVQQATKGKKVPRHQAKTGDLVFFKTGRNRYHVGFYYKDNKFIHASTSRGVVITSLNDRYWSKRYWQTRRL